MAGVWSLAAALQSRCSIVEEAISADESVQRAVTRSWLFDQGVPSLRYVQGILHQRSQSLDQASV
jgi:hypothetical protein